MIPTSFTPQDAYTWTLAISAVVSVCLGTIAVLLSCAAFWRRLHQVLAVLAFMFLGIVLVTMPKWKEIAFEFKGVKGTITALTERTKSLESEKIALGEQLKSVTATNIASQASLTKLQTEVTALSAQRTTLKDALFQVKKEIDLSPDNAFSTKFNEIIKGAGYAIE